MGQTGSDWGSLYLSFFFSSVPPAASDRTRPRRHLRNRCARNGNALSLFYSTTHTLSHSALPGPLAGQAAGGREVQGRWTVLRMATWVLCPIPQVGIPVQACGSRGPESTTLPCLFTCPVMYYRVGCVCHMVGTEYSVLKQQKKTVWCLDWGPGQETNQLPPPPAAVPVCCAPLPHSLGSSVCNDFPGRPAVVSLSPLLGKRSLRLRIYPAVTT